jgi:hypothetical protein
MFVYLRHLSCVPIVVSFSEWSILDYPFEFLNVYSKRYKINYPNLNLSVK